EEKILALIEESWRDRDFRKIIARVMGEPFSTVSDRFSAWMKDRYYPALGDAELATAVSGGIGVQGYAAKPAFYRRRDGTRTVVYVGNRSGYSSVFEVEVDSLYRPMSRPRALVQGERSNRFEAFHLFESRIGVAPRTGRLAFVTKSGEADVVHVYDLDARRMLDTYRFPRLVAVYSPTWSPDGSRLAFTAIERSGFADLFVYTPATGTLDRITNDAYEDRDPAWSPDGESLAFSSDRGVDGAAGSYNLFLYRFDTGQTRHLTQGAAFDIAPAWSPDGRRLAFVRARRGDNGRYGAQDLWVLDLPAPVTLAARGTTDVPPPEVPEVPVARRVLPVIAAASDPVWTEDDALVFGSFEHYRFTVRALTDVASRLSQEPPMPTLASGPAGEDDTRWSFPRYSAPSDTSGRGTPYRRRYALDFAQGGVSQSPLYGTTGSAQILFSDLLGDDLWYVSIYQTGNPEGGSSILRNLNASITRIQQGRRALIGYGLFRTSGLRYDLQDPDASTTYPLLEEETYGGVGLVSYPLSMFKRIETSGSLAYSDKQTIRSGRRKAVLFAQTLGVVHDNALYSWNGPVDGSRAGLTLGYTTDIHLSNVSYWTAIADVRKYWRLSRDITFAQWGTVRMNVGKEARYNLLGGSWDLRGLPFLSVRGARMWHTSHELRFPILNAPSAYIPLLAPFGIANLRGALFADAAHAWNRGYQDTEEGLRTGTTWGALGGGLRLNLFGAFVLRYDVGYTYADGKRTSPDLFRKFFFGYDF
ncbi:MAG TPA: BamA/TamA family outer membrane protein, partial [Rhodothermales bacterium]|nr:BamA/TamA family outer membrane protein [Rhodothermales bacterium]